MVAGLDLAESERRDYGRFMIEECDRLAHMVSELLEFTRGARPELTPQWVDLGDYLGRFAERLRRHYKDRGIVVELSSAQAPKVRVDRARLERALWNVATNACQACLEAEFMIRRTGGGGVRSGQGCGSRRRSATVFSRSYGKSEGIGLGMVTAQRSEEHGGDRDRESS
jgi:signal transduction histidine kinase